MATENSTNQDEQNYAQLQLAKLHMDMAHVINGAKRRMFERSREGTPLGKAAEMFHKEVTVGLLELIPGSMYAGLELDEHESAAAESEDNETSETQIEALTRQALKGEREMDRHIALVKLLALLAALPEDERAAGDLIVAARDTAIAHGYGATELIGSLLTNSPLPRSSFDEPDVMVVERVPPDVSISGIAEHMAHYPAWEKALLAKRASIGNRDPIGIRDRATSIVDDRDTYNRATREHVQAVLDQGDYDALAATVAEVEGGKTVTQTARKNRNDDDFDSEMDQQTLKVAREVAHDKRYHEATRELLLENFDLENGDVRTIERLRVFLDHIATTDLIIRDCQPLAADEIKPAAKCILENVTGPGCTAATSALLDHAAALAALGDLEGMYAFLGQCRRNLFLLDRHAYENYSLDDWRKRGREDIAMWAANEQEANAIEDLNAEMDRTQEGGDA